MPFIVSILHNNYDVPSIVAFIQFIVRTDNYAPATTNGIDTVSHSGISKKCKPFPVFVRERPNQITFIFMTLLSIVI